MRYLILFTVIAIFTACSGTDTNADGTTMDSAQIARRDSLANVTRPTPNDLNTSVQSFMSYNKAMQFDSVANYIYPTVYNYLPKAQVIEGLSILKLLEGIDIRVDSANVLRMDSVTRFSSGEATRLDYVLKLAVAIQDTGVGRQVTPQVRNMIISSLKSNLGAQNVEYNEATRTIGATIQRQALAINDTVSRGWKFIALENNANLRQIVPAEIADKFLSNSQSGSPDSLRRNDTANKRRTI
jgi:hypothetical protein